MAIRNYESAVKCLNTLQTNYSVIQEIHKQWKLGKPPRDAGLIPEMVEWVRRIGYKPQDLDSMHPIHVTGTKGKGSTCAFVQSILLRYADERHKVGLYTSPHLKSVRERIMIQGEPIAAEKFATYFFDVYDRLDASSSDVSRFPKLQDGVKPMYFRFLTLVAFHAFLQEAIDTAIFEVGIGGEYDATNILVRPTACGITSLGLDHTAVLGNSIDEIAWNKAGIMKAGVPAFTVEQPAEALKVLETRAAEKGVSKFEVVPVHPQMKDIKLGLLGTFQEKNATLACYLAAERLGIRLDPQGPLPEKFVEGLELASWPGRCQILDTPKAKWFIDGAHTAESLDAAAAWFSSIIDRTKPISLVFNQQKRDNVDDLLTGLFEALQKDGIKVEKAYFTTNQSFDAGFQDDMVSHNVSEEEVQKLIIQKRLAAVWKRLDPEATVEVCSSLEKVTEHAKGQVFATGSLLMIGGLLAVLE